jgi:sterol desaturase/sphingolipid hydroxylase (fatty acid hydroxylase superfamily)
MGGREFLSNVPVILAVMALASLLETAAPMFVPRTSTRGRRTTNLALTCVVFLLNWLLTSAAAIAATAWPAQPAGPIVALPGFAQVAAGAVSIEFCANCLAHPIWSLPGFVQVALGVVVIDFCTSYLAHRAMHVLPALWRFHRVHHSDGFVDATTTFRTHPVESIWRFLFVIVPVWTLGIPAAAVVIQRLLQATNGVLQHANIRMWRPLDRALSLIWVTPDTHKIHHSRDVAETNSNYGNVLSIYDHLLATFTPTDRARNVTYGLNDEPPGAGTFRSLLSMPFLRRKGESASRSSVATADRSPRPAA